MEVTLNAITGRIAGTAMLLTGADPKRANTFIDPNALLPKPLEVAGVATDSARVVLPPMSFAVLGG
jgi:alpha-L-arabinofuranosidase